MFWRMKRKIDNQFLFFLLGTKPCKFKTLEWFWLHFRTFCFVASKFSSCLLLAVKQNMSWKDVRVYSQSHVFSCSIFCPTGSEISHFWFFRTWEKSTIKFFFAILTVCIRTDCKFYQANEKILSYKLQGQPQKMGCSQIPIKKYAHT